MNILLLTILHALQFIPHERTAAQSGGNIISACLSSGDSDIRGAGNESFYRT